MMIDLTNEEELKEESIPAGPTGVFHGGQQSPSWAPPSPSPHILPPVSRAGTPEPAMPIMFAPPPQGFVYDVMQKPNGGGMLITCRPAIEVGQVPAPASTPSPDLSPPSPPPPVNTRAPPSPAPRSDSPFKNFMKAQSSHQEMRQPQEMNQEDNESNQQPEEEEEDDDDDDDDEEDFDLFGEDLSGDLRDRLYSHLDKTQQRAGIVSMQSPLAAPRQSPKREKGHEISPYRALAPSPNAFPEYVSPVASTAQYIDSEFPSSQEDAELPRHQKPAHAMLSPRHFLTDDDRPIIQAPQKHMQIFESECMNWQGTPRRQHTPPPSPSRTKHGGAQKKTMVGRLRAAGGTLAERVAFHKLILKRVREWGEGYNLPTYKVFKGECIEMVEALHDELLTSFPVCYEAKMTDSIIGCKVCAVRQQQGSTPRIRRKRRSEPFTQHKRVQQTPQRAHSQPPANDSTEG